MLEVHLNDRDTAAKSFCITPNCSREMKWKGLCVTCYKEAKRLVDGGATDWDELVELGLALIPGGRFLAAYRERLRKKEEREEAEVIAKDDVPTGPDNRLD